MEVYFGLIDDKRIGNKTENSHKQKPIIVFFALYFRRFIRFIQLNMIYFLGTIPVLGALAVYFIRAAQISVDMADTPLTTVMIVAISYLPQFVLLTLIALSVFFFGPFTVGFTSVMRNFTEEHSAWLFRDIIRCAKKNFLHGLIFGFLDLAVSGFLIFYLSVSSSVTNAYVSPLSIILDCILAVLFLFYLIYRFYIYQIAAGYALSLRQIVHIAYVLSLRSIVKNSIVLAVCILLFYLSLFADIILFPLFTFSLMCYIAVFVLDPVIKKYFEEKVQ